MNNILEIDRLSREDKLKIMEAIWEDLSKEDDELDSPDWHKNVLQETENRFLSGKERSVDWQDAKKDLRERFE